MKAKIFEIKRFAVHDGDGIRTTVFFKGCPLRCVWCHNPEGISPQIEEAYYKHKCIGCGECKKEDFREENCLAAVRVIYGREITVSELLPLLLEDRDFYENSSGGVTLSGGECLAQAEFSIAFSKALFERGISVNIDTCGFVKREVLERILPFVDTFLYDIKAFDEDTHKRLTRQSNTMILENLRVLASKGARIEIRYPLVVGYNDMDVEKTANFIAPLPIKKIKVLQYHSFAGSRYVALGRENTLPKTTTTFEDVERCVQTFKSYGLNAVNGITE